MTRDVTCGTLITRPQVSAVACTTVYVVVVVEERPANATVAARVETKAATHRIVACLTDEAHLAIGTGMAVADSDIIDVDFTR